MIEGELKADIEILREAVAWTVSRLGMVDAAKQFEQHMRHRFENEPGFAGPLDELLKRVKRETGS